MPSFSLHNADVALHTHFNLLHNKVMKKLSALLAAFVFFAGISYANPLIKQHKKQTHKKEVKKKEPKVKKVPAKNRRRKKTVKAKKAVKAKKK